MHWNDIVEGLKDRHRVVVPNLSHLFMSENRLLFSRIVDTVADFLRQQFPGEKFTLVGMSFGGAIAWGVSVRYPDLVEIMSLLNPLMPEPVPQFRYPEVRYFFVMPMDGRAMLRVLGSPIGVAFLRRAAGIFRPDRLETVARLEKLRGTKLRFVAEVIAHFSWILRNEDWSYWARSLKANKVPAMILWSKDDQLFGEEAYQFFASLLGAQENHALEKAGHLLGVSEPEVVLKYLNEFLEKSVFKKSA